MVNRAESGRLTIVIHLPQSLDDVGRILENIAKHWPDAVVDTSHADGWHIEIPGKP